MGRRTCQSQDLGTWGMVAVFLKVLSTDHTAKSLGVGKHNLSLQQIPQVILMPAAFWRTADPEGVIQALVH